MKALMGHSWYVWSINFRNIRVYTAEAVWRAKVEEVLRLMKELEATKRSLQDQIQKVLCAHVDVCVYDNVGWGMGAPGAATDEVALGRQLLRRPRECCRTQSMR